MVYEYGSEQYHIPHSMYYQPYPMMHMPYYHPYYMQQLYETNAVRNNNEVSYERVDAMPQATMYQEETTASPKMDQIDKKVLQQFMNEDGQVDIQKMLQTVGQFADTVQQVSPVIKQLNDLIRSLRTT